MEDEFPAFTWVMFRFHPKNPDPSYGNTRPSVHDTPEALKEQVAT